MCLLWELWALALETQLCSFLIPGCPVSAVALLLTLPLVGTTLGAVQAFGAEDVLENMVPRAEWRLKNKEEEVEPKKLRIQSWSWTDRLHDFGQAPLTLSYEKGVAAEIKWQF